MAKTKTTEKEVALITVSDTHFSHEAPRARAEKGKDWYKVMTRYLDQLHKIKEKHKCEVVYAGDITDTWMEPAELTNFLISYMPRGYAIPGQHDLPNHRYEEIRRTPYWTLVQAGIIENLPFRVPIRVGTGHATVLHGFPWGSQVEPCEVRNDVERHVAVCHSYIWLGSYKYEGAPAKHHFGRYALQLQGYDVAIFGDNHLGFCNTIPAGRDISRTLSILNNGAFIPRRADEQKYQPCVGLVYTDGSIQRVPLDSSKDEWLDEEQEAEEVNTDMQELVDLLNKTNRNRLDFAGVLMRSLNNSELCELGRRIVVEALDRSNQ